MEPASMLVCPVTGNRPPELPVMRDGTALVPDHDEHFCWVCGCFLQPVREVRVDEAT